MKKEKDFIKELKKIKAIEKDNDAGAKVMSKKKQYIDKILRKSNRKEELINEVTNDMTESRNI